MSSECVARIKKKCVRFTIDSHIKRLRVSYFIFTKLVSIFFLTPFAAAVKMLNPHLAYINN